MQDKQTQDGNGTTPVSEMTPEEVRAHFNATFGPWAGIEDNERYLFTAIYICTAYGADHGMSLEFDMLLGFYIARYRFKQDNTVLTFAMCNTIEEACARLTLLAALEGGES